MNSLKKSLIDVLEYTGLSELPSEDFGSKVWIRAICKISKKDGTMSYGVLCKTTIDSYKVKKVFGTTSSIHSISEIRPYEFINMEFVPKFSPRDRANRIAYIVEQTNLSEESLNDMTTDELIGIIMKICVDKQLKK